MRKIGKITKYRVNKSDNTVEILIKINKDNEITKNLLKTKECDILFREKDTITPQQRKKAYAIINDISKFMGEDPFVVKQLMKWQYVCKGGTEDIHLSDCTKTEARDLINVMLDYVLENGVQMGESGILRTEDTNRYLYKCCELKRCCISGQKGELYSIDTFGDTTKAEFKKICLSKKYYDEALKLGKNKFCKKYQVYGVKYNEEEKKE